MTIGKMIRERRQCLKMTQKELAEKLSVTQQTVCKWENEQAKPDIWALNVLSDALGYSVQEMLREKPEGASGLCSITNKDTSESFNVVGIPDAKAWIRNHINKYVIKVFYGFNIHYWLPKENEHPHVIMP